MEHIDRLKEIEPHIYNGGEICFYPCKAAIQKSAASYPSIGYEITGADCYVLADLAFPSVFELLFISAFRADQPIEKLLFHISLLEENGFSKCRIDVLFPGFSISKDLADWILNKENQHITNDPVHLAFYAAQKIVGRYSGDLAMTEHTDDQTVFTVTLYQESDELKNPPE